MTLLAERFSREVEIEPTVSRARRRRREPRLSTKSAEIEPRRAVGGRGENGLSAKDFGAGRPAVLRAQLDLADVAAGVGCSWSNLVHEERWLGGLPVYQSASGLASILVAGPFLLRRQS